MGPAIVAWWPGGYKAGRAPRAVAHEVSRSPIAGSGRAAVPAAAQEAEADERQQASCHAATGVAPVVGDRAAENTVGGGVDLALATVAVAVAAGVDGDVEVHVELCRERVRACPQITACREELAVAE